LARLECNWFNTFGLEGGVYLQEKQLEVVEKKILVQQSLLQIRSFIDAQP